MLCNVVETKPLSAIGCQPIVSARHRVHILRGLGMLTSSFDRKVLGKNLSLLGWVQPFHCGPAVYRLEMMQPSFKTSFDLVGLGGAGSSLKTLQL